jgi:hypothetical protein
MGLWRACSIEGTVFQVAYSILDGCVIMEDEPHSGRPCTSKTEENVTNVRTLMKSDRHLTVTMISSELNLNHQTVHDIFTEELGMQTLGCCMTTMLLVTSPSP